MAFCPVLLFLASNHLKPPQIAPNPSLLPRCPGMNAEEFPGIPLHSSPKYLEAAEDFKQPDIPVLLFSDFVLPLDVLLSFQRFKGSAEQHLQSTEKKKEQGELA